MPAATSTWRRLMSALTALVLLTGLNGCTQPTQPDVQQWRTDWSAALDIIPNQSELDDPPDERTCERVLGELREIRPDLTPAPDDIVGNAAEAWFVYAEDVFFTCFDSVASERPVVTAYDTLERLRAEVETALGTLDPG